MQKPRAAAPMPLEPGSGLALESVAAQPPDRREYPLTDAEFAQLRALVHARTGIALSEAKRELVYGRLARRVRKLKLASFAEYCELLKAGSPEELQEFTNAITTNLTSFFREHYHFDCLVKEVFPYMERYRAEMRRFRIWSAGCSTGEEPYSIAIVMRERLRHLAGWDMKLLATDIDSYVVASAAQGVYAGDRFKGVSPERMKRWFPPAADREEHFSAAQELRELISFKQLNLMGAWPMQGPFDVIFCRNVIIYFDKTTQRKLFDRMAALQDVGGWLFVGHSENLLNVTPRYRLVGRTVYRKVA